MRKLLPFAVAASLLPSAVLAQTVAASRAATGFAPAAVSPVSGAAAGASIETGAASLAPSLSVSLQAPSLNPATFPAAVLSAPAAHAVLPLSGAIAAAAPAAVTPVKITPLVPAALKPAAPAPSFSAPAALTAALPAAAASDDASGERFSGLGARALFDGEKMRRPLVESWTVDGKTYASTAELVKNLPLSAAPVEASYTFSHTARAEPARPGANAAIGAFSGGVFGAIGGAIFYALASALGEFADVIFLQPGGSSATLIEALSVAGAIGVIGAIWGAISMRRAAKAPEAPSRTIHGRVFRTVGPNGESIFFERAPGREGARPGPLADLAAFAQAPTTPAPAAPAPWPAWKRALVGLGLGAASAAAYFVPLVNIAAFFMVPGLVARAIEAKLRGRGLAGGLLGAALGALATVGAFLAYGAAQTVAWYSVLGVFAAVLAVAGAALGLFTANSTRAAAAEDAAWYPDGQFWSNAD